MINDQYALANEHFDFVLVILVMLPFVCFVHSALKYRLPTPLAFLLSCGFLKTRFPVVRDGFLFLSKQNGIFHCDLQTGETVCIHSRKAENLAVIYGDVFHRRTV